MSTTETTTTTDDAQDAAADNTTDAGSRRAANRPAALTALAALIAGLALVGYGIWDTYHGQDTKPVPTESITYTVTGNSDADITYLGNSTQGEATTLKGADLPWKKTVNVPLGQTPSVRITLGKNGDPATCTIAINGRHARTSSAFGPYGRATCDAALPKTPADDTE